MGVLRATIDGVIRERVMKKLLRAGVAAIVLCGTPAFADQMGLPTGPQLPGTAGPPSATVGDPIVGLPADSNTGNCFPFGCAYNGRYQQVYSAGAFSGPLTITDLEFFNTAFNSAATSMNDAGFVVSRRCKFRPIRLI
jgi:hypothetical protein